MHAITSRTRRLYSRPPAGPVALNQGSALAKGLVGWYPIAPGPFRARDFSGRGNNISVRTTEPETRGHLHGGKCIYAESPFNGYGYSLSSAVTSSSAPLTMSGWFAPAGTGTYYLMGLNTSGGNQVALRSRDSSGSVVFEAYFFEAGTATATGTKTIAVNEWAHATAVFVSSSERSIYTNGGNKVTNTTAKSALTLATTYLLSDPETGNGTFGRASDFCFWNRVLSDAEIYMLYDPPTRWDLYYPLGRVTYTFGEVGGGGGGNRRRRMLLGVAS
jgi:hypothetical protein